MMPKYCPRCGAQVTGIRKPAPPTGKYMHYRGYPFYKGYKHPKGWEFIIAGITCNAGCDDSFTTTDLNKVTCPHCIESIRKGRPARVKNPEPIKVMKDLFTDLVSSVPQLKRGKVWCITCGTEKDVDAAECLATAWPKCCGQTMTLDSPEERKRKRA